MTQASHLQLYQSGSTLHISGTLAPAAVSSGTCQDKLDKILDIVTETRALVGLHNHLSLAALWAPFSMPKRSINSASLAALCDTDFKHKVAEAMGAPEDVCMVLNKQLPQQFVCGGHIIPILQAAMLKDLLHLPGINHTRNGIIWCIALQVAYTHGAFGLGVDDSNEFFFVLLDRNWECLQLKDFGCPKHVPTSEQEMRDLASYQAQLGDITYGQLQGVKLTFPSSMRPSTRCCLVSAELHLQRAKAGEVLLDSADLKLLQPDRMSRFDAREMTLNWLAASEGPLAKVPSEAPSTLHSGTLACKSATSVAKSSPAASERSVSRSSSVSTVRGKEASAAASKALAGL
ncbi:hypothetical protein ABBQ38_004673 [Trebouxia sp. C0009 RCD-2024]